MTEQQKASELVKYAFEQTGDLHASIQLCLKLCKEILIVLESVQHSSNNWQAELNDSERYAFEKWKFWSGVRMRIESGNLDL